MYRLLLFLFFIGFCPTLVAQNPHGADLKINCASCHSPAGWKIDASYWQKFDPAKPRVSQTTGMVLGIDTVRFHHGKTNFELKGRHTTADCRACHETLVFSQAKSECISCHNDVHQQTVGIDCARCHTPSNWLVDNITELHQGNGFPLTGVHKTVDCAQCHTSANSLQFNRVGNDCISCHTKDYQAAVNPNHQQAGFSTNCVECHDVFTPDWTTNKVKHDFFPLNKGHELADCNKCHSGGNYANTPNTCNACHQPDYNATQSPSHVNAHFPNDCALCHTTDPDWTPAVFTMHDGSYFPIYSGKHKGQWTQCVDCHDNAANYTSFTCTNCHLNPETNNGHAGVNGYVYENSACLACHPTGDAGTVFDHNNTNFPLSGAHLSANCLDCHAGGYVGTPTQCAACHTTDFNQSVNPNHVALNLSSDCATCHTTTPGWAPATFPMHNNYYVLNGAHAAIANDCATCHNGNYNNTPNTCNGCHNADYTATTNPNHVTSQLPTDCATCHSETAWTPSTFNHNTVYPFVGVHIQIADDCNACHHSNYTNTPNTCNGCHNADYTATTNPNHVASQFPTDCATCHTQTAWTPSTFDHNTIYPFTDAHIPIADDCNACHQGNYTNTPNTCNGCHTTDYSQSGNPNHSALNIPTDCAMCHTTAPGWTPATFPIHNNYYALNGAHAAIANDCATCHNGNYNSTPNTCNGCHNPDYTGTSNPNHVALQFPTDCATCHSETAWTPSTFDHNTIYPFVGAHIAIANDCNACHQGNYTNTPNTCNGCHNADYTATSNPNHVASQFPTDCATCHSQTAWTPSTFDHNTIYPFTGAHIPIANDCNACHQGNYTNTPNTCNGCHTTDYNQSGNPNHSALNIPTDCAMCHTTAPGWTPATFPIHNNYYALNGAHASIANDCATCHNGNYNNTPNTCNGCHNPDYTGTSNPNHVALQFPTDCASCHSETAWTPSTFDHNTIYPFVGAHIAIANDCNACHQGNYTNTPNTCNGCHNADYTATTNPNHVASQFPTDCATCHTQTAWTPSTFDHNTFYPFTGAHIPIADDCNACHHGNYTNTPNTCNGCHTTDYSQSGNPNHSALNIPTDCAMCHTTAPGWTPATFPIHGNYYTLNGAHASIANDCVTCHNGNYNNTPNTCNGCHNIDYIAAVDPNHVAMQFPTDCATCHSETAWAPSIFNHNTIYPFTGAHIAIANDCNACHHGNYTNTPNTCAGCHTPDFTQSVNPNHVALNIPTDCAMCHTTAPGWEPANFPIHNNYYALNGAHMAIANDCVLCHNGNYNNTPNTCTGCHTDNYNQTTNPNHAALQFSTDCATCHTEGAWVPSTFNHDGQYFPIYSGAHNGEWNMCTDCHTNPANYAEFTCITCHANTETNNQHNGVNGYSYNSLACLACHPTGSGSNVFDHNSTSFPLTGAHLTADCLDCHASGFAGTPTQCSACHTTDFNTSTNPNHVALNIPTDCAMCHTTAAGWAPATFPIHNNYYALNGAHTAIANDCATCHNGNYNNTPNTCNGCHNDNYTQTTNPNHAASQFPTDCALCHSETAWVPSTFDHNSIYPFTGAHIAIANDCNACHNGNYNNTPNTCAGCHTPNYNTSANPNHVALNLPTDCAMCHTTAPGWEPATFPMHNNFWAITGAHTAIANDCATCHNGNYNNTPNTCNGCHNDDYTQTTNPNHAAAQFPTDCALCHTETAWVPATFDHNAIYPFTGAHLTIASNCNACHNGNYNNTPNTCNGCHMPNYNTSTNPNHVTLGLPTDCAMCHTTDPGWDPATFPIHNNYWAITGAHTAIANDCNACHNGNYNNTPNTCNGCHNDDYTQTTNPNHATQQFPTDCTVCHSQTAWVPSIFDHTAVYPFTGAHIPIANDCNACHNGNYNNTPNTCNGCHMPDYNTSTNPNHVTLGLPTDCAMCHTTDPNWDPATFPIHNNYWTLTGAHAAIANDCAACHNGNYNNTPTTCNGCHNDDYTQTTNPNHATQQFPTDCTVCHSQTAWVPSIFDHNAVYPFTGAHIPIASNCNECHNGNYTNTPNTCAGCHTAAYNTSTNPNHVTLNLPTDCAMCHTTDPNWDPATFPIHNNYWTLSGAHAAIANDCAACHNGNYNNTPNTCYGCHASDYTGATNPNHSAAGFPTTCQNCHNQSSWTPSTFNHDQQYFPIYSGKHDNEWNHCSDCHTNANNYAVFSCILCHEHDDPVDMADHHQGVSGYQYLSSACYACHPNGNSN